jgi:hypothetical protein
LTRLASLYASPRFAHCHQHKLVNKAAQLVLRSARCCSSSSSCCCGGGGCGCLCIYVAGAAGLVDCCVQAMDSVSCLSCKHCCCCLVYLVCLVRICFQCCVVPPHELH